MATTLPGRETGASSVASSSGRPSRWMRSGSAARRSSSKASDGPRRRASIVAGPAGRRAAAGIHDDPATMPSASWPSEVRKEMRRIGCRDSQTFSILTRGRQIERYATARKPVNRAAERWMPVEPFEPIEIGRTGLATTRLGLGGASIGGLFRPVAEAEAIALVEHAWSIGVRSFDVAPLYGYGSAERRMGAALATRPRDEYVLSTKIGRLVRPRDAIPAGADV